MQVRIESAKETPLRLMAVESSTTVPKLVNALLDEALAARAKKAAAARKRDAVPTRRSL